MTQYRGLYINHVYYNSKADIDEAIKQREINNYKMRCEIFAMRKTMEASIFADQQAEILHNEFGISWEELERIETEAYANA